MAERTVILSDTHFGASRAAVESPAALRSLWQDAHTLVINGDVAEVHDPALRTQAARMVMQLHEMCEHDGVQLKLISGNHDGYLTDHRHLLLADDRVLVTHGDVLHPAIAPWFPKAHRLQQAFTTALRQGELEERIRPEHALDAARHANYQVIWNELAEEKNTSLMHMLLRPWTFARLLWYWHTVPGLAARFAGKYAPSARFVIFGHTHHQGIWRVGRHVVINTGSFGFPGRPRAVVIEDQHLSVWPIERSTDAYQLGKRSLASFDLAEFAAQAA